MQDATKCSTAAASVNHDYDPAGDPGVGYANPISFVFDWCYDYLSTVERADLVSKIRVLRGENKNNSSTGVRNRFHWHETFRFSTFAYIASVLAIEGEPGVTSELRKAQNVLQNLQELGDEVSGDGGYRTYFYQGNLQTLPFLMWSYATDMDFAQKSGFSENLARWAAYKLSPTGHGFVRGPADDDAVESGYTRDVLSAGGFYLLASHFDDPLAQWLGNHHRKAFEQSEHWQFDGPSFVSLIHYDPIRPSETSSGVGLPLSVYFREIGMVHNRSSWQTGPDVIHSWFYNGPAAGHTGENQNHFTVWRGNDPLIMKGGNYLGSPSLYQSHYYERTVSNNAPLFSPHGSSSPDHEGGQTRRWSNGELSDETYPVSTRVQTALEYRYSGEIVHYEDATRYTVASGDAGLAYNPTNVFSYVRDYVHLKPAIFLIRDRFDTAGVATVRSLIHSRRRPVFTGSPVIRRGSVEAGIFELADDRFVLRNGRSEAAVDVLWPSEPTLRFVGGEGYEGYADGYNTDPATDSQEWLHGHWELEERIKLIQGQWRTEIETTPSEADGNLVFAVYVSEQNPQTSPHYSVAQEGGGFVVTVTHNFRTWVVTFPNDDVPTVGPAVRRSPGSRQSPNSSSASGLRQPSTPAGANLDSRR